MTVDVLEGWYGKPMVFNEAMLFNKPCIKAELSYFRNNNTYWTVQVGDKRRSISTYGLAVP